MPGVAPFVGFVGLNRPSFMPDTVEVGWTTAAALEALRYGFAELGLAEIVAFTAVPNAPSRRVMERIGMTHDPAEDFDHPNLPDGHALQRHVLYRATRVSSITQFGL